MRLTRRAFLVSTLAGGCQAGLYVGNQPAAATQFHEVGDTSKILYDFGRGMSNFQCHAFDDVKRHLFVLQHSDSGLGGPARISRYDMDSGPIPRPIDTQNPSFEIGHQTLDVEHTDSGLVKLWGAIGPKFSLGLVRFDYNPYGPPKQIEKYLLFDPHIFAKAHCTASISYDQKYVIARGLSKRTSFYRGRNCIAIFSLNNLVETGPGVHWPAAEYLWPIDDYPSTSKFDPQAIASDGTTILVLYGPLQIDLPNIVRRYSLDGELLSEQVGVSIGLKDSAALSGGAANEFEGAKFARLQESDKPVLTVGMIQGGPTYYKRIWTYP